MNIGSCIAALRKDRGLSQEALAESVGVSRQAVTKWEAGESQPDLENLIALASFFGVTVDSLIRADSCGAAPSGAPFPGRGFPGLAAGGLDSLSFGEILRRAKRATYAGKGAETASSRPSSHDLAYREGDFYYYDTYFGGEAFVGEEAVWIRDTPAWSMNYAGRVLVSGLFPSDFLKEALCAVPPDLPFRGPRVFERGDFAYHCMVSGDLSWFQGGEEILVRGVKTYECVFHGGAVH